MHSLSLKDRVPCCKEEAMERRICVAFLAICLLLLGGTKAASLNGFESPAIYEPLGASGNHESFDWNRVGHNSFNDNGNGFESPAIYEPLGASGNHESFDWNRVGHNSFNDNGNGF
ncbi:uncharacterized protein [Apteryx mantelli]|uniref:Uncharacterized protein isoform X4 n=1 Tax=Apteryx mantelli TaxID=2696672 RepID=A0A8B7JRK4_9AVES